LSELFGLLDWPQKPEDETNSEKKCGIEKKKALLQVPVLGQNFILIPIPVPLSSVFSFKYRYGSRPKIRGKTYCDLIYK
jgi:hypothetical protein